MPIFTYCGQSTLGWSETCKRKIRDLEQRSHRTILPNPTCLTCVLRLPTVENTLMRKTCNFVFDCLQGNVCTPFKNYFNFLTHNRDTRNCRATVVLPKVKLEFARKSFYFSGANIFNSLPLKTRQTSSRVLFRPFRPFRNKYSSVISLITKFGDMFCRFSFTQVRNAHHVKSAKMTSFYYDWGFATSPPSHSARTPMS